MTHFYHLTGEDLKAFREIHELPKNINTLYLWTERGSLLHAKSLNTDKAWEAYDYLLEHYFRTRDIQTTPDYSALSPQLQFMIKMEQRQNALEKAVHTTNKRLDGNLRTGSYQNRNYPDVTHYTTEVLVENVYFTGARADNGISPAQSMIAKANSAGIYAEYEDLSAYDNPF